MKGVRFSPDRLVMTKTTDDGVSKLTFVGSINQTIS